MNVDRMRKVVERSQAQRVIEPSAPVDVWAWMDTMVRSARELQQMYQLMEISRNSPGMVK